MKLPRRLVRVILQIIGALALTGIVAALAAALSLPRILQVEDELGQADYILPLAGEYHRAFRASELYKAGLAPVVLLSQAHVPPPSRFDEAREGMGYALPGRNEMRRLLLLHLGVPESALVTFGRGHVSTVEEAEAFRTFLESRPGHGEEPVRVILVTSPFHTRRAKMTFEDVLPGVRFMVTSPPEYRLGAKWWEDRVSAIQAVLETAKFAHYLVGGGFRAAPASP